MPIFCYNEFGPMEQEFIAYPTVRGVAYAERTIPETFPPHWHNDAEFTVILKEGSRYKIGDTVYKPAAGDILLVWPRELHELLHMPKGGAAFIQFTSSLIESNTDLFAASRFLNACHLIQAKKNPSLAKKIAALVLKIRAAREQKYFVESRSKILASEILVLVGDHVMKEYSQQIAGKIFSDRSWAYIRAACAYIAEHSSEDISQSEVAQKIGLSPYYFSKLFNEYTKTAFPAYLANIRVQRAITLLADPGRSITDCAYEAGFQSTTTFNKLFHELTGTSPREYRKLQSRNK